VGEKENLH